MGLRCSTSGETTTRVGRPKSYPTGESWPVCKRRQEGVGQWMGLRCSTAGGAKTRVGRSKSYPTGEPWPVPSTPTRQAAVAIKKTNDLAAAVGVHHPPHSNPLKDPAFSAQPLHVLWPSGDRTHPSASGSTA